MPSIVTRGTSFETVILNITNNITSYNRNVNNEILRVTLNVILSVLTSEKFLLCHHH